MVKVIALYGPSGSAASRSRRQSIVALLPEPEQAGDLPGPTDSPLLIFRSIDVSAQR
jgi:hypothetical protein